MASTSSTLRLEFRQNPLKTGQETINLAKTSPMANLNPRNKQNIWAIPRLGNSHRKSGGQSCPLKSLSMRVKIICLFRDYT